MLFVVAQNDKTYAKLSFNVGPGGQVLVPVEIDFAQDFGPSNQELWDAEYASDVKAAEWLSSRASKISDSTSKDLSGCAMPYDFADELEDMDPSERQFILDEFGARQDPWGDESEVGF